MADLSQSTHRKPVSLNDRHYRLLQDLSAPPKQPPPPPVTSFKEEEESVFNVKFDGRRRICKAESEDDNIPKFCGITDFDSSPEEEKPTKVRIEGRRRLCKVSSGDDGDDASREEVKDDSSFDDIADFDSPIPLDLLSIEKKRVPENNNVVKKVHVVEYASAESLFSLSSSPSDSSLDVIKNGGGDDDSAVNEYEEGDLLKDESDVQIESNHDEYVTRVEKTKKVTQRVKENEPDGFNERLRSVGRSSVLSLRDESEDDEDDFVVLTGKKVVKKVGRPGAIAKDNVLSGESETAVLENHAEAEDDGSIILPGLKSTYKLPGDDMGLGKTMQICSFLAGLFHSKLIKRVLVVAPKTLLTHWIKELSVVGLSGKTREYFGTSLKARDYELQYILQELWALFNFCCPDLLGDNKWFKQTYEHPILRGNEKNASDREKRIGSTVAMELRERIQPYFLHRMKNEVFKEDDATTAKLSRKNEIIVWLRLTACQQQLYEAFLRSEIVLSAFDGSPLAALTILKKICDHPLLLTKRAAEDLLEGMESMLNPEDVAVAEKLAMHVADVAERTDFQEKHDSISCKISFVLSLLDNLIPEGHNVLIFSRTRKMLNLIKESLVSNGYELLRIDGTTKVTDRAKIVDDFQEGNGAPIFLLTSQVGGLGLTLTKADRVIVVDPAWNPRKKVSTVVGNSSSSYSLERNVDGAARAFNPKDVNLNKKTSSPDSVGKLTESEILERINRLSQLLGNKVTVLRLPDQGAKLQKQISELNSVLIELRMEKATERGVISLDDITGEFERGLNV
ncbi:hypothetical protein Peur_066543 [Populus x canadensis]